MLGKNRILAVVPARGGSKGIPRKNLQPVLGVSLIARVGLVLKELTSSSSPSLIDRAVVSTDDPEIVRAAQEAGIEAPFFRPPELSGDSIGDLEVLTHALLETEKINKTEYQIVVMLQPTSPLRKPAHVSSTIQKLVNENLDAVWTVSETDSKNHPFKQLTVTDRQLSYYSSEGSKIIARQQLGKLYHRNGAAYAITRSCLLEQKTIMGRRSGAVVIKEPMVSIDTLLDLKLAEWYLENPALR